MTWIDYREKLGIGFNDNEKTKYLSARILNKLAKLSIDNDCYYAFCDMTGSLVPDMFEELLLSGKSDHVSSILKTHAENFNDFISYYVAFVNCQTKLSTRNLLKEYLCNCLDELHLPYEIIEENKNCFIFPKGAKELDDALVSQTLTWLNDYPLTKKAWVDALKSYSESTELTASATADNFRKALERFFQEFFKSEKSLENFKSEYGQYLSSKEIPKEISNDFNHILKLYTDYMNNYAKHHDRASRNVLEYIMYQTGNTIRLMITLSKS